MKILNNKKHLVSGSARSLWIEMRLEAAERERDEVGLREEPVD